MLGGAQTPAERFHRLMISLSGGTVVIVATFLRDVFPKPVGGPLLICALACFTVTVITSLVSLYKTANSEETRYVLESTFDVKKIIHIPDKLTKAEIIDHVVRQVGRKKWMVQASPLSFVLGLISLFAFVIWNLSQSSP